MLANWKQIQIAAVESDQLGYWGFVLPDHYMWGADRGGNSTFESWTALTYLAAKTEKIRLGTLVTPIPFSSTRNARKDCVYSRPPVKRPDDSRCRSRLVPDRIRGIQRMEFEQDPSRQDPRRTGPHSETLDPRKGRLQW